MSGVFRLNRDRIANDILCRRALELFRAWKYLDIISCYNYNMRIYISGISGTGMGPLALMAKDAGMEVFGSDLNEGAILPELLEHQIEVKIGAQDGRFLQQKIGDGGVDWFAYTSALPDDHPELLLAKEEGLKITKRDDLTAFLIEKLDLKMVAVAGTHGKTTTTAMIVFAGLKLGLPIAYLVGTTLGFATSGAYKNSDKYFVYEADEYDRNFLKYRPWLSVIPYISYDHSDIYPTREDYQNAFRQFIRQSANCILAQNLQIEKTITLAGEARRADATLALNAILKIVEDLNLSTKISRAEIIEILNEFPGVGRRFEKLRDGLYSDYAHHPEEIKATIELAREEAKRAGKNEVIVIYQPHQNTRQHEIQNEYFDAFEGAEKVFWLPTYLTRENSELEILSPENLISKLKNPEIAMPAKLDEDLKNAIKENLQNNNLVILMTAGPADGWLREIKF